MLSPRSTRHYPSRQVLLAAIALVVCAVSFPKSANAVDYLRASTAQSPKVAPSVQGYGSAFVIAPGLLVTNEHVVRNEGLLAVLDPVTGRRAEAQLVAADPATDLALLKAAVSNPPVVLAPKGPPLVAGQAVFSVGFPAPHQYGFDRKLAQGHIRQLSAAQMPDRFTADLGVRGGDSGSPVFALTGQVVGVISGGFYEPVLVNGTSAMYPPIAAGIPLEKLKRFLATNGITPLEGQLEGALDAVVQTVAPSVLLVEVGR